MIREVTAKDEIQMVVVFQDLIWGKKNTMPFPFLVASLHNGGIIIGAFLKKELVGFCYGFPGFHQNEVYLVSHMMAVKDKERNAGLGFKMKVKQKELALERGYKKIIWTFDPLESRNAFLNILNSVLPSDRFLLEWSLKGKSVNNIPAEEQIQSIVTWEMAADIPVPLFVESISKKAEFYKVPVPNNIHTIKERDIAIAKKWRIMLRNACNHLFEMGYIIHSFQKTNEPVNYYIVSSGKVACFSKTIQDE